MAQPARPDLHHGRISQLLPSVKCSSCSQPVPLDQLADHVCAPVPPVPAVPKSIHAPSQPASALVQRLQNLVSPTRTPSPVTPTSPSADGRPARTTSMSSQDTRSSYRSSYSTVRGDPVPERTPSSAPSGFSASSQRRRPSNPPMPLSISRQTTPTPSEPTPRAPSSASTYRPRLESAPTNARRTPASPGYARSRAPSNASMRSGGDPRPLMQRRPPGPPSPFPSSPSPTSSYPPSAPPSPAPSHYAPSLSPHVEIDTKTGGEAGMAGVGRRGFAAAARAAMFAGGMASPHSPGAFQPPPWVGAPPPQGMDGRRANAPRWLDIGGTMNAAASPPASISPHSISPHSPRSPFSSNAASTTAASTSLPQSNRSSTVTITVANPGPSSSIPFPIKPAAPFMLSHSEPKTPTTPTTPRLPFFEKYQQQKKLDSGLRDGDSEVLVANEDDDDMLIGAGEVEVHAVDIAPVSVPLSPTESSEYGGLAYASSEDETEDDAPDPRDARKSAASSTYSMSPGGKGNDESDGGGLDLAMLLMSEMDEPLSPTSPHSTKPIKLPTRSLTTPGLRESGMGALVRGSVIGRRGGTISGAIASSGLSGRDKEKEDVRENDRDKDQDVGPEVHVEPKKKSRPKDCVKCGRTIGDGRWIRVESGKGVLCDKCWKNMYLPKCRRCNLPIEKQAVSSSDGQLKGKYHRECFNCYTCHKPFPDKTFYVFDGKPFCDYHYHEANDSLCAAPDCGLPIEGPCAVSHAGGRYHPEHLTCEYELSSSDSDDEDERVGGKGRRCTKRLVEYWEVEGRMLCERHMRRAVDMEQSVMGMGLDRLGLGDEDRDDARAMRRMTRFIDLAGLGAGGLGGSGLR